MELEFDRSSIVCLQKLTRQLRSQEQTVEVRLSDGMPDIGRVLGVWGQAIVRSKEWNSDSMAVSCGVMAWVLYKPEDGESVFSVETWLPFQMKWDLPETDRDGTIVSSCLLRSIDARSISARKMIVRATMGAMGEAWLQESVHISELGELPEDVKCLHATYPVLLPAEAGEKAFMMEEQIGFPAAGARPEKLMYYTLQPEILDKKVMAGRLVFRGKCILHVLYRGDDDKLHSWDSDIPFSQYADLNTEHEQEPVITIHPCVTSLEVTLDENGNLQIKAGILAQYLLYEQKMIKVVEDAYSPVREVSLHYEQLDLPSVLDYNLKTVRAEQRVEADVQQMLDVTFTPCHGQIERAEDMTTVRIPGMFQSLYYDEDGDLCSASTASETVFSLPAEGSTDMTVNICANGKPQVSPGIGNMDMYADVAVEEVTVSGQGISVVSALELGEQKTADADRPSLVLCRKGSQRLWDIAKNIGSTVEAIMEVNHLQGEPEEGRVLLVPVS